MTALTPRPLRVDLTVIGGAIVGFGFIALVVTFADVDLSQWLGGSGWTMLIIVPGLLLLTAGLATRGSRALGLTIAGCVVTTIGSMLLAMDQLGRYDAWAYAWALIPAAVGLGLVLHGLRSHARPFVTMGIRVVAIALGAFAVAGWFFETLFQTGEPPVHLADGWPLLVIAIGAIVMLLGLFRWSDDDQDRGAT
jgi:hypothetical protein